LQPCYYFFPSLCLGPIINGNEIIQLNFFITRFFPSITFQSSQKLLKNFAFIVNSSYESFIHVNIVTTCWIQNPFIPIYVVLVIFIMILSFIFDFFLKIHFGHKHIKPPKIVATSIIFGQLLFFDITSWIIFVCFKYIWLTWNLI
jgi:hypothetical protein